MKKAPAPTGTRTRAREGKTAARSPVRTPEIEQAILNGILDQRSLVLICEDEGMPSRDTVHAWLAADEQRRAAKAVSEEEVLFLDRYKIAVSLRTEAMGEEILAISDDGHNDTYMDEEGNEIVDYDHIQRCKLRVDTRKWLMAKLLPKKYGDKPAAEVNVNNSVHNHQYITESELRQIQEERQKFLTGETR
jgi:hypothetical protein